MSPQDEQIARLGFEAWADNIIVNFIEDHKPIMVLGDGHMTLENEARTLFAEWKDKKATIVVRAYAGKAWQTHEQTIGL